jgi:putative ABC transport system permease protein
LAPAFRSDAQRNFDRAKALLVWAAALTALCILLNTLMLSVEARRREIAILRMTGMTRSGVFRMVAGEAFLLVAAGLFVGVSVSLLALRLYVWCDATTYPAGMAVSFGSLLWAAAAAPVIAVVAVLLALRKALSVKPLEAASVRVPR